MKKIERPDWIELTYNLGYGCPIKARSAHYLNRWFTEHIEPINAMLEGSVAASWRGRAKAMLERTSDEQS